MATSELKSLFIHTQCNSSCFSKALDLELSPIDI